MSKWTILRGYSLPVYQNVIVEAETAEAACALAVQDDDGMGGLIEWDDYSIGDLGPTRIEALARGEHHDVYMRSADADRVPVPPEFFSETLAAEDAEVATLTARVQQLEAQLREAAAREQQLRELVLVGASAPEAI